MSQLTDYEFVTIWQLEAPIEEVWEEICHPERWSRWWKGVESVTELKLGDENGVGFLDHFVWKSRLPYELAFDVQTTGSNPRLRLKASLAGSWKAQATGGSLMKMGLRPCAIHGRYIRRNPG